MRSLLLATLLVWLQPGSAQRIALIDNDDPASPIVRASIAECNSTKLLDPSLVRAAVNGAGYSGSINLSLEEARGLGLVTGAEILVLLRSYFAASGNPAAPIEAFVAALVVDGRTGSLIHFEVGRATGDDRATARMEAAQALAARLGRSLSEERTERSPLVSPVELDLVTNPLPSGVRPPRFFSKPDPKLTLDAERASIEATVDVVVTFGADASYGPIWVSRWAGFGLDEEAVRAIRAARFLPAQVGGKNISSRALLRYNFRVRD